MYTRGKRFILVVVASTAVHMQREFCAKEILENVQRDVLASLDERSKQAPKPRKIR